jgi:[ribosomal protein S18]-alanine N-acetyltransferase
VSQNAIRRMEADDLDRVLSVAAALATAPHWERAVYEAAVVRDSRYIALVAEDTGVLMGFAIAGVVSPEAELESIAVSAEVQRTGVGAALLAEVVAELRRLSVTVLDLEVRESNLAAIGFYHRAGFREIARRRGYYRDPVEDALLLRMTISLD